MTPTPMTPQEILKEHLAKTIILTDDEFNYFFSHFKPALFKKRQIIISEGDHVDREYFVLNGCLKTFYVNEDQKMHILQFAMPTWWASTMEHYMEERRLPSISTDNADTISLRHGCIDKQQ